MDTEYRMQKNIMRRVYALYVVRTLTSPVAKFGAFASVLLIIRALVSVRDVLANTLGVAHTPQLLIEYVGSSFFQTEFSVQLFFVILVLLFVSVLKDVAILLNPGNVLQRV